MAMDALLHSRASMERPSYPALLATHREMAGKLHPELAGTHGELAGKVTARDSGLSDSQANRDAQSAHAQSNMYRPPEGSDVESDVDVDVTGLY